MKALIFPRKDEAVIDTLPDPKAGEVVVAVKASGICGTDIEVMHGAYGASAFPLVPGHEFSGEVIAVGAGVDTLTVGTRVVIDPNIHCGECDPCGRGLFNLCDKLGAYGVSTHGGFAEQCVVRAEAAIPIGDLDFATAALCEPLGCVLNGIEAIGIEGVRTALVFGAGPIGLLMGLALKAGGVGDVTMVDITPSRLELARSFGLGGIESRDAALADKHQAVDLVVDCTGVAAVAATLTTYAINGGKVLYFGVCSPDARIEISPFEVFRRQLTLAGAHSLNHNIPQALAIIQNDPATFARLISDRVTLEEIPSYLKGEKRGGLKVQALFY
jgi:threonine dehydrogenase-like Zn-dependent dehydrogenase